MQHVEASAQVAAKQRVLEDNLARVGKVTRRAACCRRSSGPRGDTAIARDCRCATWRRKGGVLVGFHERRSSFVADTMSCEVLSRAVSSLIPALREMFGSMRLRERLPQLEVAVGESVTVFVLRHLEPIPDEDAAKLRAFADRHGIQWWLQPKGPGVGAPVVSARRCPRSTTGCRSSGSRWAIRPTEFTQVNAGVNRVLVRRAVDLLDPRPGERVGDLFCGLGNFTLALAIARRRRGRNGGRTVAGGARTRERASSTASSQRATFIAYDLYADRAGALAEAGPRRQAADRSAPRRCAGDLQGSRRGWPARIVYVSCSPATLARDAGVLVNVKGYRLLAARRGEHVSAHRARGVDRAFRK